MNKRNTTIRDVAQAAGVSIATVSRALKGQSGLSEATRAGVIQVAQRLGYNYDKLREKRTRRILFLYRRAIGSPASNVFYSHVLHGAESCCRDAGVMISLMSVGTGDDLIAQIHKHEPDALLAAGYFDDEPMDLIRQSAVPWVLVDHLVSGVHCFNADNQHGAWLATRHLLDSGAKRVAAIFGPLTHHSVALRAKGFRRALFEARVLADPDLEVSLDPALAYADAGREAMKQLLALPQRPDAVFAYSDRTALSAIEACLAAGLRVPEDIRVVGYDDIETAATNKPSLSTIRVDKEALGYAAASALIEGRLEPGNQLFEVSLVVRESSGGEELLPGLARAVRGPSR
jgi:LacI family repressor for deo operon, udp, cdd, tsx, nupC, and nupG